jgi:tRNA threonylcarbamoyladenosine biosynthesis protein TsaE
MVKIITHTEKETIKFADRLAKQLQGGEIIGLVGDLGAGKTVFVKGLAKSLGIKKTITSPTFVLMKIYSLSRKQKKIKNLVHIDAYRLVNPEDIITIGANEYWQKPDTVTVIEWADKIKKILPRQTKFIRFKIKKESREIEN